MATIHNTFIRKFGRLAIVITVTDWNDFKELEQFSEKQDPDFLVGVSTTKSIYSNMQPSMQINTYSARDITEETKGMGIAGILTEGGYWAYRKAGLTYAEEISKPNLSF